jgi:hypothetical protein
VSRRGAPDEQSDLDVAEFGRAHGFDVFAIEKLALAGKGQGAVPPLRQAGQHQRARVVFVVQHEEPVLAQHITERLQPLHHLHSLSCGVCVCVDTMVSVKAAVTRQQGAEWFAPP